MASRIFLGRTVVLGRTVARQLQGGCQPSIVGHNVYCAEEVLEIDEPARRIGKLLTNCYQSLVNVQMVNIYNGKGGK